MKKVTLILSEVETDNLVKLLDGALKTSGYAAKEAVLFIDKLVEAYKSAKEEVEEVNAEAIN